MLRTCWSGPVSNALEVLFADRGDGYADWCHNIASPKGRQTPHHGAIGYAVTQRATASPWPQWWADTVEPMLRALPDRSVLAGLRQQLVENFARPIWLLPGWTASPPRAWPPPGGRRASTSSKPLSVGAGRP